MKSLLEHRKNLMCNPQAYTFDIERCYSTVVKHLKDAGFTKITLNRAPKEIKEFVNLILESQSSKPFFHINSDSGLPFCWNSPAKDGWDIDYIKYEWGHLRSKNQNGSSALCAQNLCLQSARCNQHIQSSMNIEELKEYGGKLEAVINKNQSSRESLFQTNQWITLINRMKKWK